ncbi:MAG: MoaD/ThiS family protein [Actinobacteria bacterium ATB1]|nr:MoaD/ThiS family protein [Actinobacteria bacterium ATB1]
MPVEVRLPTVLRQFAGGEAAVESEGATVGQVLADLSERYPGIAEQLSVGNSNDLPRFVNVYLNDEDIRYLDQLETQVAESDVISIMPAVSGGG